MAIFEGQKIRRHWDEKKELWYFSIVDITAVLMEQLDHKRAQSYWTTLKNRLKQEGSEVVTKCDQLKMQASDGKYYLTDVADTETMFSIIQSIPSPKAEPFKLWLARVGGGIAGNARKQIEAKTGKGVITNQNAKTLYNKKLC